MCPGQHILDWANCGLSHVDLVIEYYAAPTNHGHLPQPLDLFQKTHFLVRALNSLLGKQALLVLLLFQLKYRCCQGSQWDVVTLDSAKHCSLLHQFDNGCRHLSFSFPFQPCASVPTQSLHHTLLPRVQFPGERDQELTNPHLYFSPCSLQGEMGHLQHP